MLKKFFLTAMVFTMIIMLVEDVSQQPQNPQVPSLENNEELSQELIDDLPYTFCGENENWEITLAVREDTQQETKLFQSLYGETSSVYRTELFVKASEEMKKQILSGAIRVRVQVTRLDGLTFPSILEMDDIEDEEDSHAKKEYAAMEQKLNGDIPVVIGENSEHYSTGLMFEKQDSYTAVIEINNGTTEEIILDLEKK